MLLTTAVVVGVPTALQCVDHIGALVTGLVGRCRMPNAEDWPSAVDGFDAHMAAAMADFEEESHSSSEEDLENEPVS